MLSERRIQQARERLARAIRAVTLVVHQGTRTPEHAQDLWDLAAGLAAAVDAVDVRRENHAGVESFLALEVKRSVGIEYWGLPLEGEWLPFLDTLSLCAGATAGDFPAEAWPVEEVMPGLLEIFVQPQCANCGQIVRMGNALAWHVPQLTVRILDVHWHEDRARDLHIMATPTLLLNGVVRWAGALERNAFFDLLRSEDQDWVATLKSLIDSDALDGAIDATLRDVDAARAVPHLLKLPEMSYHMAALRLIEACREQDPRGCRTLRPPLETLLDHANPTVRGDAVYGLGLLQDPDARPALERAARDADEDVREAALEGLDALDQA